MPTKSSVAALALALFLLVGSGAALAQAPPSVSAIGNEVTSDFKYLANNFFMDAEDVVTAPLYAMSPDSALGSPKFYLVLAGAGAIFGGSFALDQTMRSHLRAMSSNDADLLQNFSYGSVS